MAVDPTALSPAVPFWETVSGCSGMPRTKAFSYGLLATRGSLGGLSRATHDIIHVMDAMGKDIILVETVGVGQDEVKIVNTAHTCIVVLSWHGG